MGQIRGKYSLARSEHLHCAKKVVAALYKLDTEDPAACPRMVECFLKEDRFNCSPDGYEVTFFCFVLPEYFSRRLKQRRKQRFELRFLAPQIPDQIFAQFYSGKKRRGRMDPEFLEKIYPTFLCLTTTILCHALRC